MSYFSIDPSTLNDYSNIHCDNCQKTMIVKENTQVTLSDGLIYNLCEFCAEFANDTTSLDDVKLAVKQAYASSLSSQWTGFEPRTINYL